MAPAVMSMPEVMNCATPNLCFLGMITAERLADDQEYNDLVDDLRYHCNEVVPNSVVDVKVPRPYDPLLANQYIGIGNYGKAFLKFVDSEAAQACKDKTHGRLYGGYVVYVYYISDGAFSGA